MRRRAPRPSGPGTQAGLLERLLFRVMGPPELGDATAAPTTAADPGAQLCPRCRRPWDEHERVRTPTRGYMTCPPDLT